SLHARKGEEVPNWLVNTNKFFNFLAEVTERTIGTAEIRGADREGGYPGILNEQGLPEEVTPLTKESFLTAWKAADLQYESLAGTENGGIGDWLVDTVSWLANKFESDREGAYPGILNEQGLPEEVIPLNQ